MTCVGTLRGRLLRLFVCPTESFVPPSPSPSLSSSLPSGFFFFFFFFSSISTFTSALAVVVRVATIARVATVARIGTVARTGTVAKVGRIAAVGVLVLAAVACGLNERSDFLVGRPCRLGANVCDAGQVCLPHARDEDGLLSDYYCRDAASFVATATYDPPLAYCDPALDLLCPGALVCNADRIREDAGPRPLVCKTTDDPFAPPVDAGSAL